MDIPSKHARSNSEVFWLQSVIAILQPAWSQNWAGSYMLDTASCIWFSSVLPKKACVIVFKTSPDLIWMAWSSFGQMHMVQKQAGVQESSGLGMAECKRPTTSLYFQTQLPSFHWLPASQCAKPAQIWFGSGWLCRVWDKWIRSSPEARIISGLCLANASEPIQIRCELDPACLLGMFKTYTLGKFSISPNFLLNDFSWPMCWDVLCCVCVCVCVCVCMRAHLCVCVSSCVIENI